MAFYPVRSVPVQAVCGASSRCGHVEEAYRSFSSSLLKMAVSSSSSYSLGSFV